MYIYIYIETNKNKNIIFVCTNVFYLSIQIKTPIQNYTYSSSTSGSTEIRSKFSANQITKLLFFMLYNHNDTNQMTI